MGGNLEKMVQFRAIIEDTLLPCTAARQPLIKTQDNFANNDQL
jgi:hypothetical protein